MRYDVTYARGGQTIKADKTDFAVVLNTKQDGIHYTLSVKALDNLTLTGAKMIIDYTFSKTDLCFCNGYQSCTDTKEFGIDEKLNNLKQVPSLAQKLYSFRSYGDIAFYEYQKGVLHGHDFGYVKGNQNIFIGNNYFKYAGIIIEFHTEKNRIEIVADIQPVELVAGQEIKLMDINVESFMNFEDLQYFNQWKPRTTKKLVGYSSWYNHFDKINDGIIIKNLIAVDNHFDLFQIDDGWASKVGDWLECDREKFPNGLELVFNRISEKELMAGLWMAPFIAAEGSKTLANHPDWFKKDKSGKMIKCGCNWGGFYALDFYNEEVREYIKTCLLKYKDLGFRFFKLDFLYAVSLPVYEGKNRSQVACEAYQWLRDTLGEDVIILGNSGLMAPAFGVFDYMRVGCSVTTEWDDSWLMRHMHRERNSTKTTIQNTIYRSILNGKVFMNDPDVFLLRDENMKLTRDQRYSLAIVNAIFGSVLMTSDDISNYDITKKGTLELILDIANNASYQRFRKNGENIEINFSLHGKTRSMVYNTESGVIREVE